MPIKMKLIYILDLFEDFRSHLFTGGTFPRAVRHSGRTSDVGVVLNVNWIFVHEYSCIGLAA